MKIEASYEAKTSMAYSRNEKELSEDLKDKKLSAKEISNTYLFEYQMSISIETKGIFSKQADVLTLADIGYTGKPIGELSQDEAKALVAEDGFFGVAQTSQRIADFVIGGGGDDVEKLKSGRAGMLQGFKEAEELWGGKLPDISYETMKKSLEMVDARIAELGGTVLDSLA
ncbi:MAG: hydrogenase-4 component G [Sulfurospirillaceae bacterium]|nr:hydrogenase-4 component G [Sulfurospirillaceae bacterium]MDD3462111.1 hydrogenase-4 component G [Sulfurospirillaceae bacterium]